LVVSILRAAAYSLDDCVDKQPRSFPIKSSWLLPILVLAVVGAVSIEEFVAKKFLNSVKELLHQAGEFAFNRHLEDVEIFVCAQLFFVLVCCYLFYGRAKDFRLIKRVLTQGLLTQFY